MGVLGVDPSIKMNGLSSSFWSEEYNFMRLKALEEYTLDAAEAAYEEPGEQAPIVFMASWGGFNDGNASHWAYQKHH